jgi:hypothetical protein
MSKVWHFSQSKKEHLHSFKGKLLGHIISKDGILIDLKE